MVGKPKQQELEAVGDTASTTHKQRAMNECMQVLSTFYSFYMVQYSLPREWLYSHTNKYNQDTIHKHAQRPMYQVNLDCRLTSTLFITELLELRQQFHNLLPPLNPLSSLAK